MSGGVYGGGELGPPHTQNCTLVDLYIERSPHNHQAGNLTVLVVAEVIGP